MSTFPSDFEREQLAGAVDLAGLADQPVPVILCGEPAPLAMNGGDFVTCTEVAGHEGLHAVRVRWGMNK